MKGINMEDTASVIGIESEPVSRHPALTETVFTVKRFIKIRCRLSGLP